MQLTEQLLGHKLGIGGDTLQQKDGHDGDGKQLKLQNSWTASHQILLEMRHQQHHG